VTDFRQVELHAKIARKDVIKKTKEITGAQKEESHTKGRDKFAKKDAITGNKKGAEKKMGLAKRETCCIAKKQILKILGSVRSQGRK